jgi:GNAT superfamily N-acetyltransferase
VLIWDADPAPAPVPGAFHPSVRLLTWGGVQPVDTALHGGPTTGGPGCDRCQTGAVEDLSIAPATVERWPDLVTVFGTRGDPSWCWCQFFLTTGNGYRDSAERNRADLERQVREAEVPPGLLAYRSGEPIGWLQLGPRTSYPRVTGQAVMATVVGDRDVGQRVWRTTCFVVRVGHRRQGVAGELLAAGVKYAAEHGADVLEGHPVDVSARPSRPAGAVLYHGTMSMFTDAGFVEIGRTAPTRPVMRRHVG